MRSPHRCPDDLLARCRRGPLSVVEQRALDAHLAICGLCAAARAFATLYDNVPDRPRAEDDALVARLADRIVGGRSGSLPRHRMKIFASAAAMALVAAAGAAAAWVSVNRRPLPSPGAERPPPPEHVRSAVAIEAPGVAPGAERPPFETADREAPAVEAPLRAPLPTTRRPIARRRISASAPPAETSPVATPTTAAELFAAANAARRARDLHGAIDRYLALERRFPDSDEALVSRVVAGDLLSRLGEREAALQAFDRYLVRSPEGALAPEALFGRAQLLESLGRRASEVDAWQRLLRVFPGSIYETAARRRLDELLR